MLTIRTWATILLQSSPEISLRHTSERRRHLGGCSRVLKRPLPKILVQGSCWSVRWERSRKRMGTFGPSMMGPMEFISIVPSESWIDWRFRGRTRSLSVLPCHKRPGRRSSGFLQTFLRPIGWFPSGGLTGRSWDAAHGPNDRVVWLNTVGTFGISSASILVEQIVWVRGPLGHSTDDDALGCADDLCG